MGLRGAYRRTAIMGVLMAVMVTAEWAWRKAGPVEVTVLAATVVLAVNHADFWRAKCGEERKRRGQA